MGCWCFRTAPGEAVFCYAIGNVLKSILESTSELKGGQICFWFELCPLSEPDLLYALYTFEVKRAKLITSYLKRVLREV